ncbi:uncharacterized protein LOC135485019 [Lineus longissimus]|uniref:uncharacterized protein LOC135485019 n=1 Tax=Lineus longissimus TaxID=88925 RepID=UPI00315CED6A
MANNTNRTLLSVLLLELFLLCLSHVNAAPMSRDSVDEEVEDTDISRNKRAFQAGAWNEVPDPHKKRQYEGIFITDGSQKRSWDALGIPDKRSWDALGIPDRRSWDALGIPDRRSMGLNEKDVKALASFIASRNNRRQ